MVAKMCFSLFFRLLSLAVEWLQHFDVLCRAMFVGSDIDSFVRRSVQVSGRVVRQENDTFSQPTSCLVVCHCGCVIELGPHSKTT